MIKEELNQEAEEYFKSICGDYNEEYERTGKRHYWVGYDIKNAYLASAESREKRIAELEQQMKRLEEENNELKEVHESDKRSLRLIAEKGAELEKENTKLKEENKKWKDEWQEQVQKANDESYARTLQTIQLNKAKEIIKKLYSHVFQGMGFMELNDYNVQKAEAEQFLKECEK